MKSENQVNVEKLLSGIGHPLPSKPALPSKKLLMLYARLLMEEALEYVKAAGIDICVDYVNDDWEDSPITFDDLVFEENSYGPDFVDVADGLGDVIVIATGGLSLCGIADQPLLNEISANNLAKLANGKKDPVTGKFIKPQNHPRPDIEAVLKDLGWEEGAHEDVHVPSAG